MKGHTIYLGKTTHTVSLPSGCIGPVSYYSRWHSRATVFLLYNNQSLTRASFSLAIRKPFKSYARTTGCSIHIVFRIGTAISAKRAGVINLHVNTMGRWKVLCMHRHLLQMQALHINLPHTIYKTYSVHIPARLRSMLGWKVMCSACLSTA